MNSIFFVYPLWNYDPNQPLTSSGGPPASWLSHNPPQVETWIKFQGTTTVLAGQAARERYLHLLKSGRWDH